MTVARLIGLVECRVWVQAPQGAVLSPMCHKTEWQKQKSISKRFEPLNTIGTYRQSVQAPRPFITGLTSKADVDAWMNDDRRIKWLRSQGYAN